MLNDTCAIISDALDKYNLNPGNWTFYIVGSIICIAISYVVNKYSKIITQIIY